MKNAILLFIVFCVPWFLVLSMFHRSFALEVQIPPSAYDYEPAYYMVRVVSGERLRELCPSCDPSLVGWTPGAAVIYLHEGLSPRDAAKVLRHEKAHLNGWRH